MCARKPTLRVPRRSGPSTSVSSHGMRQLSPKSTTCIPTHQLSFARYIGQIRAAFGRCRPLVLTNFGPEWALDPHQLPREPAPAAPFFAQSRALSAHSGANVWATLAPDFGPWPGDRPDEYVRSTRDARSAEQIKCWGGESLRNGVFSYRCGRSRVPSAWRAETHLAVAPPRAPRTRESESPGVPVEIPPSPEITKMPNIAKHDIARLGRFSRPGPQIDP